MTSDLPDATYLVGKGLACRRGNAWLFKDLHLSLQAGQVLWLRGANGCGKTSLLRLAVGLAQPDEGSFSWHGRPVRGNADFASKLVYLGHAHSLNSDLTAQEALEFLTALHGRSPTTDQLTAAMKRLAVHHRRNQTIRVLSQGQRKRVALARLALETAPGIWVLDEPFDALDSNGIAIVNALLQDNIARGGSILLTSHLPVDLGTTAVTRLDLPQEYLP